MSLSMTEIEKAEKEICPKLIRMIYRQWKKKSLMLTIREKGDKP